MLKTIFSDLDTYYLERRGVFGMKRIKTHEWALKDSTVIIVRWSRPLSLSKKDKRSHSIFRHFSWPRRHWWWSIRSRSIRIDGCKTFSWDFLDIFLVNKNNSRLFWPFGDGSFWDFKAIKIKDCVVWVLIVIMLLS